MELRHLRYFVAVVEEQSFTKAAEKLFIAQPPLSRQIQNLEAELGIQLFERGSRPLQTTPAGQFFYQHAVKLLSNAEEVKSMTKRVGMVERTVTMGFVGSLLYGLLPRIVYLFRQQQPQLKIELIEMSSHPLASQKQGVYLADLVEESLFLYPSHPKPNFSTQVRSLFSEYGLEPRSLREVREIQLALGLVAAGEGICIVPESACSIQFPHLNYIPLLDDAAVSPIFLAIRSMDESEDIRSLFDCIYQVYDLEAIKYDRAVL